MKRYYIGLAVILLNTAICYTILNVGLAVVFMIRSATYSNPVSEEHRDVPEQIYPDFDESEREQLLDESRNRPYVYSDYTHFSEQPFSGRYVNVDAVGFRHGKNQGPWPLDAESVNVFVFGGSTTFGYGVADWQTVPSLIQEELAKLSPRNVRVYNFGVGWYYSTQERLLFEKLLYQGHIPDLAIFIDGLNDTWYAGSNRPAFTDQFASAFENVQAFRRQSPASRRHSARLLRQAFVDRLPVGRMLRGLSRRLEANSGQAQDSANPMARKSLQFGHANSTKPYFERAFDCFLHNKYLIEQAASRWGVLAIFVWQPSPGYKYDMKLHAFVDEDSYESVRRFYEIGFERWSSDPGASNWTNFIWAADIQEKATEQLYVDHHHYSSSFSRTLAEFIISAGVERGLLTKPMS